MLDDNAPEQNASAAAPLQLFGYFRSTSSYRCRIALNLKGLAHDHQFVHLKNGDQHSAAFQAMNPQKLLPVLVTPDGAALRQSLAILEWLEESYPDPAILPQDPVTRARIRAFALVIACEVHPLQNLRVLQHLRGPLGSTEAEVATWLRTWIGDGLATCEALLQEHGTDSRFAFGDLPSIADICLVPQVFAADRFDVDITGLPRVQAVCDACAALDAFTLAHPARQPDYAP